ncbi:unnamed protein product [Trichogramma brassicae]|uniref:Uncharacterized protein n=1 Tax=Trichogramma brassicae TaxID=86971 RepID=A0A6H5II20_9HYME|nr:unnamed protein product [Trichogramma brassicae]
MKDGKLYQVSHLKKIIESVPDNVVIADHQDHLRASNSQPSMSSPATARKSEEVSFQTSTQPVHELDHADEDRSSFSTPATPRMSKHATPGTPTSAKSRNSAMNYDAKVTPLQLKKKEGLWRPVERRIYLPLDCADLGSRGAPASVPTEVSCNKYNCVIGSWLHETRLASRRTRYQNHSKNDYEKL